MHIVKTIARGGPAKAVGSRLAVSDIDGDTVASAVLTRLCRAVGDMASCPAWLSPLVRKWVAAEVRFLATVPVSTATAACFDQERSGKLSSFVDFVCETLGELMAPVITTRQGKEPAVLFIDVPVYALHRNLRGLVHRLVEAGVRRHCEGSSVLVGGSLAAELVARLCAVSGLSDREAREKPHRLRWPGDSDREGERLVKDYLGASALAELLLSVVRVPITDRVRMEHMVMTAGAGHGKSQSLQHMIAADLARPKGHEVGMIVIDSQNDLVARFSRLKAFAGNDRLLLVDAADVEFPVALNLFDLGGVPLSEFSVRDREQILNATVGLYEFVIGGLGASMTEKQSSVFRYLIRLMMSIEGATIHTLRACLEEPHDFVQYMEQMPGTARHFFLHEFLDRQFNDTRKQILRRLYGVLENPAFERMFSSTRNKLDLYGALNAGRVVLCNTSREFLGDECRMFGRYCIAVALKAAFDRARLPMEQRRTSYLYVDEASDYFDESVGQLLVQARKYKLGVILAHQALDQMSDGLRALVMSNTSVKLAGGVSAKDARSLSGDLRTSPEFILAHEKRGGGTSFATLVRNVTPAAVSWSLPFGTMEAMPQMSDAEFASMLARNCAEVSAGRAVLDGDGVAGASRKSFAAGEEFGEDWN